MSKYNQFRAMLAITRASLRSITRSPSAVVFTLLFPLIFIIVFGFIGNNTIRMEIGVLSGSEKSGILFEKIQSLPGVVLVMDAPDEDLIRDTEKGRLAAVIRLTIITDENGAPKYLLDLKTSSAAPEKSSLFKTLAENVIFKINMEELQKNSSQAELRSSEIEGRRFSMIDFILPGQLGFSILSTGVFGTAFVFFNLRQTLVIKRFFATPIQRPYILLGEALSRMVFSLTGAAFIITIGYFVFGFTLINGLLTALQMMLLSAMGLVVFMGFGFAISGLAKNESMIPPLANIITLPQFLLSGTFFPIESFPQWLQPVCNILPLTYLNDALRLVAFEGAGLFDIKMQLFVIVLWGILVYTLAVRVFRWE